MNKNIIAIAIALGIYGLWKFSVKPPQSRLDTQSRIRKTEMCKGKKTCSVVYVAPWCSACESLQPTLVSLLPAAKNNPDHGLLVIVGSGKEAGDNEAKADEIGFDTIVDNHNKLADELNVRYFPTIVVIDESLKIKLRDQEALGWIMQTFATN